MQKWKFCSVLLILMSFRPAAVVTVVALLWYTEEEFLFEPSEIIQQLCV